VIDGKQAVYGCSCNEARKYEDFIWNHRHIIADYLEARVSKMNKQMKEENGLVKQLKKATKK